jgi:hypothetical protein
MNANAKNRIHEDLIVQMLYSQIRTLCKVVTHIQSGNDINGFVDESVKSVEKDLRWLRKSCLNN